MVAFWDFRGDLKKGKMVLLLLLSSSQVRGSQKRSWVWINGIKVTIKSK